MAETGRRIFPGNNSTYGFYSYYSQCLDGMAQIYILKGGPGTGKSSLMKRLSARFTNDGFAVEQWLCSSDPDSLDGIVLRKPKIAVVDGTAPHVVEPQYPGAVETIVNLGDCWEEAILKREKNRIKILSDGIAAAFEEAYRQLAAIGKIDEFLKSLQSAAAAKPFIPLQLPAISGDKGELKQFFAMAMTPLGVIDLRQELCENYKNRFFLWGSNCAARNACLDTLTEAAIKLRLDCEIGYGAFQPKEPVIVLLPSLDLAVVSTETLPEVSLRKEDRVIAFDVEKTEAIYGAQQKKAEFIKKATAALAEAHRLHDELEAIYINAMDFTKVERLEKTIYQNIMNYAAKG